MYSICCADKELKKRYKLFVGLDPDDHSVTEFSFEQLIEMHAKHLAFWSIERKI